MEFPGILERAAKFLRSWFLTFGMGHSRKKKKAGGGIDPEEMEIPGSQGKEVPKESMWKFQGVN